jgi:hypothetical protein
MHKGDNMEDWYTRLEKERTELYEKIKRLKTFLYENEKGTGKIIIDEYRIYLLYSQLNAMQQYLAILDERIALEGENNNENDN